MHVQGIQYSSWQCRDWIYGTNPVQTEQFTELQINWRLDMLKAAFLKNYVASDLVDENTNT